MKRNKLYILTNSHNMIPQLLHETESIPILFIRDFFISKGFTVVTYTFDEFNNNRDRLIGDINGSVFIYASSQYTDYYSSIEDTLLFININGGILVPDFINFKGHENKFFQELIKTTHNLSAPKAFLISNIDEGIKIIKTLKFPLVAKLASGYGSNTVKLLRSDKEAVRYLNSNFKKIFNFKINLYGYFKKVNLYKNKYPMKIGKVIFQELVENARFDWKVLIFGNKIFTLKRFVRNNDFRASGSGLFDFESMPSEELLKFSLGIRKKLKTPWVSLDIIDKDGEYFLIEYQCVHFGLYTVLNNIRYFEFSGLQFIEKSGTVDVKYLFAEELYNFINYEREYFL